MGMNTRSIKRKLFNAKSTLSQTIQRILDINQRRKRCLEKRSREELMEEELKLLNKIAARQAQLIRYYEGALSNHDRGPWPL
jgi:hypothetical protein